MNCEVKVNVINQLMLLRQSSFKDKLSFLDENVQNAQRALATEVKVTTNYSEKLLTIENNGLILEDPQKLFSIAESGWSQDIQENENPFGIGFFSNISVSSYLEIFSGNKQILFDVARMIEQRDPNVEVIELDSFYEGFKLILHNFDYGDIPSHKIAERVTLLGKFVEDTEIYYNGTVIPKIDLLTPDTKSPFFISPKEKSFTGWLALSTSFSPKLRLFYRGRLVQEITDMYYVEGNIYLGDSAVNLTAPDRKDIIQDAKWREFRSSLREYVCELAADALLNSNSSSAENYIDSINWYVKVDDIKNQIRFQMFRASNDEHMQALKKIVYQQALDEKGPQFVEQMGYLLPGSEIQPESHFEEVLESTAVVARVPTTSVGGYSGGYYGAPSKPVKKFGEPMSVTGGEFFPINRPIFWLKEEDLYSFEIQLNLVREYDLLLLLARNTLEEKVLQQLEAEHRVFHLKELRERIVVHSSLTHTSLNIREQRALMLLEMISRVTGQNKNVFAIGNLMVSRTLTIPELGIEEDVIELGVVAVHNEEQGKIYIDRDSLNTSKLSEKLDTRLRLSDYKFIMAHAGLFARELNLLSKGTTATAIFTKLMQTLGEA